MPSLRSALQPLGPHISEGLLPTETFSQLLANLELLPEALSSAFGFECPLGTRAATPASFALYAPLATGGPILSGEDSVTHLPEQLFRNVAWRRLHAFGARWTESTSRLHQHVPSVRLRFDASTSSPGQPLPDVFVSFNPKTFEASDAFQKTVESALHLLLGAPLPFSTSVRIARSLHALPPGSRIVHAGAMLSRQSSTVRLCIGGLTGAALPSYLQGLGWVGNPRSLSGLLNDLRPLVDTFDLSVDIGNEVMPRIILQCHMRSAQSETGPARNHALLDYLVGRSICTPEQREALLDWTGGPLTQLPDEVLEPTRVARRVGSLQLIHVPGGMPEARAFFGAVQRPFGLAAYRASHAARAATPEGSAPSASF
jgi:hypothetical protein